MNGPGRIVMNIFAYQVCWWLLVIWGNAPISLAIAGITVILHLWFYGRRRAEWLVLLSIAVVGAACDSGLVYMGVFGGAWANWGIPLWLVLLWLVFATLFNVSLTWFHHRLGWAALFGGIGGALSYWGGARLGAIESLYLWQMICLWAIWTVLFPLLIGLSRLIYHYDTYEWPWMRRL
ncbi:MAG: hypothetical protein CENE_02741 [Candidatus Celerinatantimonas neptuna]|nr:MAG: hypothetical protein CENE_02741 [Candidatus Celerinatantimonas neptuna]